MAWGLMQNFAAPVDKLILFCYSSPGAGAARALVPWAARILRYSLISQEETLNDRNAWWLPLIQGIIAVALGLFILLARQTALLWIGTAAALYMLVAGVVLLAGVMLSRRRTFGSLTGIRGIAGVIIGGGLLIVSWFKLTDLATGYTLMAIGLIVFGGLGVAAAIFEGKGCLTRLIALAINGLLLLWGIMIFVSRSQGFDLTFIVALILLALGAILIVYAFLSRGKAPEEVAEQL